MKSCGFQFLIIVLTGFLSLPAFGWNFFGNNDDDGSYSGYQSNSSGTIYVKASAANFRSAPFVDGSSVFGSFRQNTALRVIRKDSYSDTGTWYFVSDGHGHTGWVNAHLVSRHPVSAQSSSARVAHRAETASAPLPKPRPAQRIAQNSNAPAPSAAPASAAPAPAQSGDAPWPTPVQKPADPSVFPPPPDFSVGPKKDQAAATPAAPATAAPASADPAKPATAAPTPAKTATTPPSQQKPAAPAAKPPEQKQAAKKLTGPVNGCLTHYPSQNYDEKSGDEAKWEQEHNILKQIQTAIGGKMANASYANQSSSMFDIKVSFSGQPNKTPEDKLKSAPIVLNFTGGIRNSQLQTIHVGAKLCVTSGKVTAELTDSTQKSKGKIDITPAPELKGFAVNGTVSIPFNGAETAVNIDETLSRTSK